MSTTKKYVSLEKLGLYDDKIKAVISAGDEAALASAKEFASGLASNYEPAGSVNTAKTALENQISAVEAKADAAQSAADTAQGEVDALETLVGTLPSGTSATTVIGYVDAKTAGIATDAALEELNNQVSALQEDVQTIGTDYLKAADKTELSDAITAEANRADAAEKANAAAIDAIGTDYLKAADKTELQGNIDANAEAIAAIKEDVDAFFADADMTESAKDTLKELQEYIASDESGASAMAASIKQNSDDIDALEGKMTTVEGKVSTLEGEMDTAQSDIANLQAAIADGGSVDVRFDALEAAIGESGSVADDIATAKQEAINSAAADATTKAGNAESAAKTYADGLNTAMNTRVEALEAIDHDHSNKAELDLIVSGDKAKWDAAAAKAHEHSNLSVLEGITSTKVAAWDNAESAAKTYADGLNTAMDGRVAAVETWQANMIEASEEEINALFA